MPSPPKPVAEQDGTRDPGACGVSAESVGQQVALALYTPANRCALHFGPAVLAAAASSLEMQIFRPRPRRDAAPPTPGFLISPPGDSPGAGSEGEKLEGAGESAAVPASRGWV